MEYKYILKTLNLSINRNDIISSAFLDTMALLLVYFVPSLSHLTGLPIYYFEPMRLMLILSIVHSRKINSYFLAISLPAFSFIISSHPVVPKMLLISFELLLNITLISVLQKKIRNVFSVVAISILLSKLVYYALKYLMLENAVLDMEFFSTPWEIQLVSTAFFSLYVYLVTNYQRKKYNQNQF